MNKTKIDSEKSNAYNEFLREYATMGGLLERYYSDLYYGLLKTHNLLKMFPKLSGEYEEDKTQWRKIVDNRMRAAEKIRSFL